MSRSRRDQNQGEPTRARPGFERLYDTYGGLVYAKAVSILRDRSLAEDATQETWLRAARALDRGFEPRDPQAWILRIAGREAIRASRRSRRGKAQSLTAEPAAKATGVEAENREYLEAALERLPAEDRALLRLRFLEGRSYRELRNLYGLSTSGLWDRVTGALERLRRLLSFLLQVAFVFLVLSAIARPRLSSDAE